MGKYICNIGKIGKIDLDKISPIFNSTHSPKPEGGLWCCDINTKEGYSWRDFCISEEPSWLGPEALITVKDDAKIYVIDSVDSVMEYAFPDIEDIRRGFYFKPIIDYKRIASEYDIIDFRISDFPRLNDIIYGLDCDCCVIMNKNIIENIEYLEKDIDFDKLQQRVDDFYL